MITGIAGRRDRELMPLPLTEPQAELPPYAWTGARRAVHHDTPEHVGGISALTRVIGGKLCGWTRPLLTCYVARAGRRSAW
jgi:hypothetical protein